VAWLADENFNNDIVRGLLRRRPGLDIVRVQDVGLRSAPDDKVLAWAANERRLLLTHDVSTVTAYAYQRVRDGLRMPGVFEVRRDVPIATVIDDVLLLDEFSEPDEWEGQVRYLPLL
jgi:hypothetical protein